MFRRHDNRCPAAEHDAKIKKVEILFLTGAGGFCMPRGRPTCIAWARVGSGVEVDFFLVFVSVTTF